MSGGLLRSFTDEHQWTGACKLGCSANEHEAASLKLIFCFYNWTQLCETVFIAFWMYCVQWVENYDLQQARENLGKRQKNQTRLSPWHQITQFCAFFLRKLEPWTARTMWLDRRDAVDPRQSYLDICTFFSLHIFYSK